MRPKIDSPERSNFSSGHQVPILFSKRERYYTPIDAGQYSCIAIATGDQVEEIEDITFGQNSFVISGTVPFSLGK